MCKDLKNLNLDSTYWKWMPQRILDKRRLFYKRIEQSKTKQEKKKIILEWNEFERNIVFKYIKECYLK